MKLHLSRPIIFFDIEATGLNPSKDRIVEMSYIKVFPDAHEESDTLRFNPEMPISAEASAVNGITDADVADCPTFKERAHELNHIFDGSDIAGFNSNYFDIPMLVEEYNGIGHVPYREKDKVYKEFHDVLDKIYKDLHISTQRRRLDNFKSNLKSVAKRGEDAVDNERSRLMRRYEQLKQEVSTYENNLGFLNIASKRGNSLVDEMNRKVQKLKDEVELTRQKIKAIDNQNKEEKTANEAAENKD